MARARISDGGNKVKVSLTFDEAAALFALLCAISERTSQQIDDALIDLWDQLHTLKTEQLEEAGLWPKQFEEFALNKRPLVRAVT